MYERFTDRARDLMRRAHLQAQSLCHEYIGTEHALLALLEIPDSHGSLILHTLGISPEKLKETVSKYVVRDLGTSTTGKLPHTPRMKKLIEYSMLSARELNHSYVGTEHLLCGMIREEEGVAAQVLAQFGVKLEQVLAVLPLIIARSKTVGRAVGFLSVDEELSEDQRKIGETCLSLLRRSGLTRKDVDKVCRIIQDVALAGSVAHLLMTASTLDSRPDDTDQYLVRILGSRLGPIMLGMKLGSSEPRSADELAAFFENKELEQRVVEILALIVNK